MSDNSNLVCKGNPDVQRYICPEKYINTNLKISVF